AARIAELAQSGGQYWYEFVQRLVNDGIAEGSAELQEILHTQDWQRLLATPADAYWRQLQQRFGDQQAAAQIAVAAQASFARGVQDALERAIRIAIEDGQLKPDTDAQQMLFEMHGLILALHHDARLMRNPGALQRARLAYERVVNFYLVDGAPAR
ncbi:MAG TPA: hypothetical protein PLO34_08390, partial [Pseudoxanthomonas sp.]|nr:hypothetical protein [Pseudoxanthomonas sp.]